MTTNKKVINTEELAPASASLKRISGGVLTLGKFLESIRLAEGLSQTAFAKTLGVSRMYLCDLEKGRRNVSLKKASEMATILGYSQAQFCRLAVQDQAARDGLHIRAQIEMV